jgi:hypothetical protein
MRKFMKFSIQIACIWLLMLLTACSTNATQTAPHPTSEPAAQQTEDASPSTPANPSGTETLETTSNDMPPQPRLGQMQISYPVVMPPGSSKTIDFSIYIPAELADASPESFKREVLPPDNPRPLGRYSEYNALILVSKRMQIELLAPNFAIENLYPAEQDLDLSTPNTRTNWGWTITAPSQPNEYVLVVKVYIANEKSPRWVGSFDVLVEAPTAIPSATALATPTPTPVSSADLFWKNISDNAVTLIGTLLTTIVAIIGLYLQYKKPKETKK